MIDLKALKELREYIAAIPAEPQELTPEELQELREYEEWNAELDSRLKPCPKCGHEAHNDHAHDFGWQIICDNCGCTTYGYEYPEEAIDAWNAGIYQ